ncbi:galactose mutarotase-like [Anopheles albimanus]|uniref:Aldose 1-epimerase n=1 Tax=Anopheles albimanus TaxID=7167 RepID=A0A182FQE5_ANOAL|nr:galactose mutarotase-like [Anopheles albimanus]XP_035773838.1 galactose mutarotase-like [Anopheles albimanus]XP_035773839.1 galactose mutarotase-like [Anopheles albimanus]
MSEINKASVDTVGSSVSVTIQPIDGAEQRGSTIEAYQMAPTTANDSAPVTLTVDGFGTVAHPKTGTTETVKRFTWRNRAGVTVQAITYGAIITSIQVPDRKGRFEDVVLGFDDIPGYQTPNNPYFGATIGRIANRVGGGRFTLNGQEYQVTRNFENRHQLHGGAIGFDKYNWESHVEGPVVTLSHTSPDGDEGYPGAVIVSVRYELKEDNRFVAVFRAVSTKPTPINLTNHSYFNLAGHGTGHEEIYRHVVSVNADKITETDADSIPSGKLISVGGTPYDLRIPRELGPAMSKTPNEGYDENFCITKGTEQGLAFVSRTVHPHSGRVMEVYSDQPGVQLYTSNFMPDPNKNIRPRSENAADYYEVTRLEPVVREGDSVQPIRGKSGAKYFKHGAFCFETQNYPDAINHANFPSSVLNPGEQYVHEVHYKFDVLRD